MSVKEILVHATQGADCPPRLHAAAALAERLDAHLTGLFTLWIPPLPGYVEVQLGRELLQRQRELYEAQVTSVREDFEQAASRHGIAAEWRVSEAPRVQALTLNARYCDLLVMGRHNDDSPDRTVNLVEALVLESAKPVLVVPDEGDWEHLGSHVMVAWNGSREAVRAVDAALPLLEKAGRVDVVVVDPRAGHGDTHGDVPGMDLGAHLARHGVRAEVQALASGHHGVGQTLLERATADGCDLLVMGAYGHARWREVVLGGATAHILRNGRIPLLLAH